MTWISLILKKENKNNSKYNSDSLLQNKYNGI